MSTMKTTWPKTDQCVGVSTVIRPVTHTAEVAVNSASITPVGRPEVVAIGADNSAVPIPTAVPNPVTMICVGCRKPFRTA
jgi:hypothetical protein